MLTYAVGELDFRAEATNEIASLIRLTHVKPCASDKVQLQRDDSEEQVLIKV